MTYVEGLHREGLLRGPGDADVDDSRESRPRQSAVAVRTVKASGTPFWMSQGS